VARLARVKAVGTEWTEMLAFLRNHRHKMWIDPGESIWPHLTQTILRC
jgi:hypothetical protein